MKASAPIVTGALVLANLAAYACERAAIASGGDPIHVYGLVPALFVETGDVVTIFTSMFLHYLRMPTI
jgi:membrane associated rhomboid family serine protease